jgi:hypothetical protein
LIAVTTFYYDSDMSETVTIKLYYGIGEIIYGRQGVNLSNYSLIKKNVSRVGERTWEAITNWLVKAFSVDLEHQCMSVMALINRSAPVYWELMALEETPRWRSFIRNSCRVGLPVILFVQVYQKGGSSSQVHEEAEDVDEGGGGEEGEGAEEGEDAEEGEQQEEEEGDYEGEQASRGYVVTGVLDEGEVNSEMMRQYQRELEADERALEEDFSDDDDDDDDDESEDDVLLHWRNSNFSWCTINSGENVPWEYTENKVCEGVMYPSTAHLKDAVKQ